MRQPRDEFSFFNPVQIRYGSRSYLKRLLEILRLRSFKVGLFYGQESMKKRNIVDQIKAEIKHCSFVDFGGIAPNPSIPALEEILQELPDDLDWIVALGGGSVIDMAKSAAFMCRQELTIEQALRRENFKNARDGIPCIAIPTTAGSGSEVTSWASFWDMENKRKFSLSHTKMYPAYALVDPAFTTSLPPFRTAICAFDALAHAFEAFWSANANPISDLYAMDAIRLILENLEMAVRDIGNIRLRTHLARASLLAGLAFSNTKTAAVHSVSYPMTLHFGVPHGLACGLTLAEFWRFNRTALDANKTSALMEYLGGMTPDSLYRRLKELAIKSALPVTLERANIPKGGILTIIDEGFHPERIFNNPREVTVKDLQRILERIES